MVKKLVVTSILVWFFLAQTNGFFFWKKKSLECPPAKNITPCSCTKEYDTVPVINCDSLTSEEDLTSVMAVTKKHQGVMGIELHSVALRYFPADVFNGSNIQFLEMADSSILSLTESDQAFLGLEESLKSFTVDNCNYVNNWQWTHLKKLKNVHRLTVTNSRLMEISNEFLKLAHLPMRDLSFRSNHINYLPRRAFSNYTELKRLSLDLNDLREYKRDMLPVPAKKLEAFGISYNKIPVLPSNAFTEMPSLKYLYLGGNRILTLQSEILLPVWKQLKMFLVQENPIICDCRMTWLPKNKSSKVILIGGKCTYPKKMEGKRIALVKEEELTCGHLSELFRGY